MPFEDYVLGQFSDNCLVFTKPPPEPSPPIHLELIPEFQLLHDEPPSPEYTRLQEIARNIQLRASFGDLANGLLPPLSPHIRYLSKALIYFIPGHSENIMSSLDYRVADHALICVPPNLRTEISKYFLFYHDVFGPFVEALLRPQKPKSATPNDVATGTNQEEATSQTNEEVVPHPAQLIAEHLYRCYLLPFSNDIDHWQSLLFLQGRYRGGVLRPGLVRIIIIALANFRSQLGRILSTIISQPPIPIETAQYTQNILRNTQLIQVACRRNYLLLTHFLYKIRSERLERLLLKYLNEEGVNWEVVRGLEAANHPSRYPSAMRSWFHVECIMLNSSTLVPKHVRERLQEGDAKAMFEPLTCSGEHVDGSAPSGNSAAVTRKVTRFNLAGIVRQCLLETYD